MYYSPLQNGFFHPDIHGDNMPVDAVEISSAAYDALLAGQQDGRQIVPDENGLPVLTAPLPPPAHAPTLSREAFCVALIAAGILTEAEATEAALGAWPPKFEPALGGKELVAVLTIKNVWRDTKTVARDAPLFLDLLEFYGAAMKLTVAQQEALGDKIFAGSA